MSASPLRFGFKLGGQDITAEDLVAGWQLADAAGFDHLWCLDLFAAIGPAGPDRPIYEGWAMQAAMAVTTKRIRIGCTFTGNTHRPPWMLAKLAVTVDHLSGGRLEFGIGAGYEEVEHRMYAIEGLDHRVGRFSESLECLKLLWTTERVDFDGRYYTLRDAIANPKPIQKPYPPIWIGAGGEQLMPLVARHADVWNAPNTGFVPGEDGRTALANFRASSEKLAAVCAKIGRDPATIRRVTQIPWRGDSADALIDACGQWLSVGCTEQIIYLHPLDLRPPGVLHAAEAAARLLPELRKLRAA